MNSATMSLFRQVYLVRYQFMVISSVYTKCIVRYTNSVQGRSRKVNIRFPGGIIAINGYLYIM